MHSSVASKSGTEPGSLWFEAVAHRRWARRTACGTDRGRAGGARAARRSGVALRQSMARCLENLGRACRQASGTTMRCRCDRPPLKPVQVALIDISSGWVGRVRWGDRDAALQHTHHATHERRSQGRCSAPAMRAGFSAYLIKPVPWWNARRAGRGLRRPAAPLIRRAPLVTRRPLAEAGGARSALLVGRSTVNRRRRN